MTNAVTVQNGLIYAANGEAGIYVYVVRNSASATACGAATVSLLGSLNFGAGISANSVFSGGGLLYVATGLGGLRLVAPVFTYLAVPSTNIL